MQSPLMPRLRIRHQTTYSYSEPVSFGTWRLLMRPLDTHATRLIEASLETPPGELNWSYDAYGNCVCHLTAAGRSDRLKVVNNLLVDRYPSPLHGHQRRQPLLAHADRLRHGRPGDPGALHRPGDGR